MRIATFRPAGIEGRPEGSDAVSLTSVVVDEEALKPVGGFPA